MSIWQRVRWGVYGMLVLSVCQYVLAQASSPTPLVLGCSNPAPAAPGKPTVFISKCITPQWVPINSSSVVASVSKTAPSYAHSYPSYKPTDLLVACPAGATVAGATCTDAGGKDASALVAQSAIPQFKVAVVTPILRDYSVTVVGAVPPVGAVFKQLDSTQVQCFSVSNGPMTGQVCL